MNLPVDYIDPLGHHRNLTFNLSRLVFVKHMAMAGRRAKEYHDMDKYVR